MANVLLPASGDPAVMATALGHDATKVMNSTNNFSIQEYRFQEPKSGFIANVFPGENTWHSLYNHDYHEITNHLVSINNMKVDENTKNNLKQRIKETVINSYQHSAMSKFYQILLIGTLVLIVMVYLKSSTGSEMPIKSTAFIIALLAAATYAYATIWAKGTGEAYWEEFSNDLQAKIQTGKTLPMILKEYQERAENEKTRNAMLEATRQSYRSPLFRFNG
jgi:hypothetical protein